MLTLIYGVIAFVGVLLNIILAYFCRGWNEINVLKIGILPITGGVLTIFLFSEQKERVINAGIFLLSFLISFLIVYLKYGRSRVGVAII
jgi:hypothetical protein